MWKHKSPESLHAYVEARLSDYVDGQLPDDERARVQEHLRGCEQCRASLDSLQWTISLLKQVPAPGLPRQFTLPVTPRVPARGVPDWLVWSLRGVAVAATAIVVVLVGINLLVRLSAPRELAQRAIAPQLPTALAFGARPTQQPPTEIVPMAQPLEPTSSIVAESAPPAPPSPTPIMITVVPPPDTPVLSEALAMGETPVSVLSQPTAIVQEAQPTAMSVAVPQVLPPPTNTQEPTQPLVSKADTQSKTARKATPSVTSEGKGGAGPEMGIAQASPATLTPVGIRTAKASPTWTRTSTPAVIAIGTVRPFGLIVRAGPGTQYRRIGDLRRGDFVQIIGRSPSGLWLQILYPDYKPTARGWVAAVYIALTIPLEQLPVIEPQGNILWPPTPTATPTDTPTPTPTATATPSSTPEVNGATGTPEPTFVPTDEGTPSPDTMPPLTPFEIP